jgi:hypothetical protein
MTNPDSLNAGEPGRKEDQNQRYSKHSPPHSSSDPYEIAHAHDSRVASPDRADFHSYLLAELRAAVLRARILQADIEAIGLALKGGLVTPNQALALLHDVDALRIVGTPPSPKEAPR